MRTAGQKFARFTGVLAILALCWPVATAFAAAADAPSRPACCMRMSHACHAHTPAGNSIQAICHSCGWCHALPNARVAQPSTTVSIHISVVRAALRQGSESRPSPAASRLRACRAPPLNFSPAIQES